MFTKPAAGLALIIIGLLIIVFGLYQNMQTEGFTMTYNYIGLVFVLGGSVLKKPNTK
jgi:hypothetical protein